MSFKRSGADRGLHILAVHVIGVLMVIGILGDGPGRYNDFFNIFRRVFTVTYGVRPPAPRLPVKSGGMMLNATAPTDSSTARDPGSTPPPPPPIP